MKRYVACSRDSADLYVEYMSRRNHGNAELRTMTIKRQFLLEALQVLLDKIDLGSDAIPDGPLDDLSKIELIDLLNEANDNGFADYIFYLENRSSGEVFIDHTGPEENY